MLILPSRLGGYIKILRYVFVRNIEDYFTLGYLSKGETCLELVQLKHLVG